MKRNGLVRQMDWTMQGRRFGSGFGALCCLYSHENANRFSFVTVLFGFAKILTFHHEFFLF
jgi:hypothetical protein